MEISMHAIKDIIEMAIREDIGPGDITTDNLIPDENQGKGIILAKESLILAGLRVAQQVFSYLDPEIRFDSPYRDGDEISAGTTIMEVSGSLKTLLKGERTALNFLQRLSGIATHVRSYITLIKDLPVRLVDTRKTTPGLRTLEKYAVRMGGASNHRMGLYDGVLIKDNHIAACGGIGIAVHTLRGMISHLVKIEVEVSDMVQVQEALAAKADVIMLDNMTVPQIREAVSRINGKAIVEVSGMVTKKDLRELAGTGVDIISAGALTHSAPSVDISMRIL
ncbi:MAG: carboxylating nicotinate-nucleotide diphosphorylase [Desulfobacteraceae bacterium]|nr:MAG: carboxylating nicotinate-nucleotide diphosphorylase [Desulfobacteraceae bacterium]